MLRFIAGALASALLVAGAMTMLLTVTPMMLPGWHVTAVGSGSMMPALRVGDAVAVARQQPGDGMLGPPTVVLVDRPGNIPLLHRIVDHDGHTYRTQGDANTTIDTERVHPGRIMGTGRLVVGHGGWVSLWINDGNLTALMILAVIVALLGRLSRFGWLPQYDPWINARRRSHGGRPPDTGTDADEPGTDGLGAAGLDGRPALVGNESAVARYETATIEGRSDRLRDPRGRPRLAVMLFVVSACVIATAGVSSSAHTGSAAYGGRLSAATVTPPRNLAAKCTTVPQIVAAATAGPVTVAPPMPASIRDGDTLLLSRTGVRTWNGSTGRYIDPPTPSGWTRLGIENGGSGRFHAIYRRPGRASDAGGALPHVAPYADVLLVARGGVVVDNSLAGRVYESGTSITAPSVAGLSNGLLLTFWAVERDETRFSLPTGMTEVAETTFTKNISMGAHQQTVKANGPTGTRRTRMSDTITGRAAEARNSGLSLFIRSTPYASLTWTASTSPRVTGYVIYRNGVKVATLTDRDTRTWQDPQQLTAAPSTFTVRSTVAGWTSPPAQVSVSSGTC